MWKEKLPSGKVQYVERYLDPLTGKRKRVSVSFYPSGKKKDDKIAEEALRQKVLAIYSKAGEPESITFSDLCQKRLTWQKTHCKYQTYKNSQAYFNRLKKEIGDDVLVNNLNAPAVSERLECGNPTTYNESLKHFKALIRWGYRNDLVSDVSYLDKLQRQKEPPVREKDKFKYMERDEIKELLGKLNVEKWKLLTQFLILSGLRIGEAMALTNKDVDTGKREINVSKTVSLHDHIVTSAKTDTSNRIIYMQDELLKCCKDIMQLIRMEKIKFAYRTDIFIPAEDGDYICYDSYAKYLKENTESILGRRLSPHSLRHTHTAMLAEAGIPLEDISRRLGHSNSKVTKEVYLHVTEKMKEKERERIKEVKIL